MLTVSSARRSDTETRASRLPLNTAISIRRAHTHARFTLLRRSSELLRLSLLRDRSLILSVISNRPDRDLFAPEDLEAHTIGSVQNFKMRCKIDTSVFVRRMKTANTFSVITYIQSNSRSTGDLRSEQSPTYSLLACSLLKEI